MLSMTGFGTAEARQGGLHVTVTISSVNGKRLDLRLSLPRELAVTEADLREAVKQRLQRGCVNIVVDLGVDPDVGADLQLDHALARKALAELRALQKELALTEGPRLADLLAIPDFARIRPPSLPGEQLSALLREATNGALDRVLAMRRTEGEALATDLRQRTELLGGSVARIRERAPCVVADYRARLEQRLADLAGDVTIDPDRLAREVLVFADKGDITEELTRLDSHLAQLLGLFDSDDPVGRQLDFLLQECNREINTIGSKANDATLAQEVVLFKTELERLREQAQNIE